MTEQASEKIWRGRYDRWKASGLPMREFATKEKVKASSVPWWVRRMKQFEQEAGASMTFVRVAEGEPNVAAATTEIELVLPNALRLRVPRGTPVQDVVELVGALGEVRFR